MNYSRYWQRNVVRMLSKSLLSAAILLPAVASSQSPQFTSSFAPSPYGKFIGKLVLIPDGDRGRMRLVEPYKFIDSAGGIWLAPAGTISDGASIPQFAKSFIGGGWDGRYLHAAVIHDVACNERTRPWELVHLTFYHAMLAAGVSERRAKIMYAAVYHFGPRWIVGGPRMMPDSGGWTKERSGLEPRYQMQFACEINPRCIAEQEKKFERIVSAINSTENTGISLGLEQIERMK